MPRQTTLELFKEEMKFSAGHFTIFSATERENMHGHNFTIHVTLTGEVKDNGMLADYRPLKEAIIHQCRDWNETFILPERSPFLSVERLKDGGVAARFNGEELRFARRDVTLLPIENATLEEFARLFGENLIADVGRMQAAGISKLAVKCASGPGQWSSWEWVNHG